VVATCPRRWMNGPAPPPAPPPPPPTPPPPPPPICRVTAAPRIAHPCWPKNPFNGPMAAVRVGLLATTFVLNPSSARFERRSLDLVVAARPGGEGEAGANTLPEQTVIEADRLSATKAVAS